MDAERYPWPWLHFSPDELKCPCCGELAMDKRFLDKLQEVRRAFGKPMPVESGYRCKKHNAKVGGANGSLHVDGRAVDIQVVSSEARYQLVRLAMAHGFGGIGINRTTVHLDDRLMARMWHYYQ